MVKRLTTIVSRVDRQAHRFRRVLSGVGLVCFVLITADYARFIDLPAVVIVPLWLGVLLNMLRWAIWEGMIKPSLQLSSEKDSKLDGATPQPPAKE